MNKNKRILIGLAIGVPLLSVPIVATTVVATSCAHSESNCPCNSILPNPGISSPQFDAFGKTIYDSINNYAKRYVNLQELVADKNGLLLALNNGLGSLVFDPAYTVVAGIQPNVIQIIPEAVVIKPFQTNNVISTNNVLLVANIEFPKVIEKNFQPVSDIIYKTVSLFTPSFPMSQLPAKAQSIIAGINNTLDDPRLIIPYNATLKAITPTSISITWPSATLVDFHTPDVEVKENTLIISNIKFLPTV